ncbi:MAG TPA: hypothetical protein VK448_10520, partial [Dissulfurispiraceae bacterium]|nr:hypothetical protein [Dissulfurispiraceae bacterium]
VVSFAELDEKVILHLDIYQPVALKIVFDPALKIAVAYEREGDSWVRADLSLEAALADIFEISVPFSAIKAKENDEVHFAFEVIKGNGDVLNVGDPAAGTERSIERCPFRGHVMLTVPSADFEKLMWY